MINHEYYPLSLHTDYMPIDGPEGYHPHPRRVQQPNQSLSGSSRESRRSRLRRIRELLGEAYSQFAQSENSEISIEGRPLRIRMVRRRRVPNRDGAELGGGGAVNFEYDILSPSDLPSERSNEEIFIFRDGPLLHENPVIDNDMLHELIEELLEAQNLGEFEDSGFSSELSEDSGTRSEVNRIYHQLLENPDQVQLTEYLERRKEGLVRLKWAEEDEAIMEDLCTIQYSEELDKYDSKRCNICFEEFEMDEIIYRYPVCHHLYHKVCLIGWLNTKTSCTICKSSAVHHLMVELKAKTTI